MSRSFVDTNTEPGRMPRDDSASGSSSPRRIKRQALDKKRRYDSDGRPLARTLASHGPTARALEQRLEAMPPQESISAPVMTRIKVKCEPVLAPIPAPATPGYGWRHPDELPYISDGVDDAGWDDAAIMHLVATRSAFSIPERTEKTDPWVRVLVGNEQVVLPRGYRIPLMWASYFLWTSVRLVLTATPDIREQEWEQARWEILHLARLCAGLFDAARAAAEAEPTPETLSMRGGSKARMGGMPRTWRHPPFDRVLLRHHREWLVMRDKYVELFWNDYQEEEFVKFDMVKLPWDTWVVKDHKGFKLTKEHVVSGLSATELMAGFWIEDNGARFGWNEGMHENSPSSSDGAPSAIPSLPSDTHPTPLTPALPTPIPTHIVNPTAASSATPSSSSPQLPPRIPLPRERRKMRLAAQAQNQVTKSEKEVSLPPPSAVTKPRVLWDEIPRQMQRQQPVVLPWTVLGDATGDGGGAVVEVPADKPLPPVQNVITEDVEMANVVLTAVNPNPESAYPTPEAESESSRAASVDVRAVRTQMGSLAPGRVVLAPMVAGSEADKSDEREEEKNDNKMEVISVPDDDEDDEDLDLELLYPDPSPVKPVSEPPRASDSPSPIATDAPWALGTIASTSTSSLATSRSASLASLPPLSLARFPDADPTTGTGLSPVGESESLSMRDPLFLPAMAPTYQLTRSPLRGPAILPTGGVKRPLDPASDADIDLLARCERLTAEADKLRAELQQFREQSRLEQRIGALESTSTPRQRHPLAHLMTMVGGEVGDDDERMVVDGTGDVPPLSRKMPSQTGLGAMLGQ